MWSLPASNVELARYCGGLGRRHTTTHSLGSNVVSVVVPLFTSCVFPAMPAEVQFVVFYLLVSMVVTDLLYPLGRLNYRLGPSALITILDALGKYHDFPLAACENKAVCREVICFWLQLNCCFRHSTKNSSDGLEINQDSYSLNQSVMKYSTTVISYSKRTASGRPFNRLLLCSWILL